MIITITRCLNEERNLRRFIRGYSFSDLIIVSDGGSTDNSLKILEEYSDLVRVIHFDQYEEKDGVRYNPDNPHIQSIIDAAKEYDPQWIILDDCDDWPNYLLREQARDILEQCTQSQVNAFRLYCWNENSYFPKMSGGFGPEYKSLWAWKSRELDIHADPSMWHGTIVGTTPINLGLDLPLCLLHKSWNEETIDAKMKRYVAMGIPFEHPLNGWAGSPTELPNYARE